MMKKLIPVIAFMGLVACSSSPKKEESAGPAPWDKEEVRQETKPSASAARPTPTAPAAPAERDPSLDLNEALKAQNEERIKLTAEQVLMRKPDDVQALNALAMYHHRKNRAELATYLLNKALQKDSNQSALHSNLGLVLLSRGEKTAATRSFRRALELNPRDGLAAANVGAFYVQNKDYAKAVVALEMAYRQGIRDVATLNNYGVALMATGKHTQARDLFDAALKDHSNSRELLMNYAIVLVEHLGRNEQGLEMINRLKFMGAPSESRERLSYLENKAKAGLN